MNPVLSFLQNNPDYSFDEGVAVLLACSANRGVNTFIVTRRDKQHLRNELNRLAHIPNLRPLPGKEFPIFKQDPAAQQLEPENSEENPAAQQPEPKKEGDDNGEDFVSFATLKRHESYKPEDLPTPSLVDLWTKNRDDYKELQYLHSQMKQANSDAGRAEFRSKLLSLREKIVGRWKLFDDEMANLNAEKSASEEEDSFKPGNIRSNISRYLNKESWNDEQRLKVQHWVETLLKHGEAIKEETLVVLRQRGIRV